jgi:hypothetical protein
MSDQTKSKSPLDVAWSDAKARVLTAYEAKDSLGMLEAETEADMVWLKRELVHDVRRLAHRLAWLADAVESDPSYTINSVGEVQTSGPAIDARCAEIAKLRDVLKGIAQARKAAAS